MRIAVTDANIFIDLYNLGLIISFFDLGLEIHTTSAVLQELHTEQKQMLEVYESVSKLQVHNLLGEELIEVHNENYPKSLSPADKSVLYVANKINAFVLSSDKTLRNCAKNKGIDYHGMIWIFDTLVETVTLTPKEARRKLSELVETNFVFRNNQQLFAEIEKRLRIWK